MKKTKFYPLIAGFMVLLVAGGSRYAIGLILRPMAEELGWGRSTLGFAVALFLIISALCMFISGHLSDRFSLKYVLATGLSFAGVGIGFMSVVSQPLQVYILYGVIFAVGSGIASLVPIGVMVSRWFPNRAGIANAIVISGMSLGQLLLISSLSIVLVENGWRMVFLLAGMANFLLLPFIFYFIRENGSQSPKPQSKKFAADQNLGTSIKTGRFWLLVLIYAICGFQDFFVSTHIVAFAQDQGVNTVYAGNLLALMGMTGLIGVIASGLWSDRSGPVWSAITCFILRFLIFGLILTDQSLPSVTTFALLYGSTFLMTAPLTIIFAREAFGTKSLGIITGFITMVHHMAGGLGAYLGALNYDYDGSYNLIFQLMLLLSIFAALLTLPLRTVAETP